MKTKFFVQISADLLLDVYGHFFPLTPWVYLYLRFKQNYYPNKIFDNGLNVKGSWLAKELGTSQPTVWRSIKELTEKELIGIFEAKKILTLPEKKYLEESRKSSIRRFDTKNAFFQISKSFYEYFMQKLDDYKDLKIYYYLMMKNNHFLYPKEDSRKVDTGDVTFTYMWKELGIHRTTLQKIIERLKIAGVLGMDEDGDLCTFSQDYISKVQLIGQLEPPDKENL